MLLEYAALSKSNCYIERVSFQQKSDGTLPGGLPRAAAPGQHGRCCASELRTPGLPGSVALGQPMRQCALEESAIPFCRKCQSLGFSF